MIQCEGIFELSFFSSKKIGLFTVTFFFVLTAVSG